MHESSPEYNWESFQTFPLKFMHNLCFNSVDFKHYVCYYKANNGREEKKMSEFYRRLRALRGERQLTQQELADALGISKSSVNMYERGEREPGLDLLEKIARFFGVDVDDLLGLRPEQETDSREHRLRMVARRAAGLPQAQYDLLLHNFEGTVDVYLQALKLGERGEKGKKG